jgi:23S rRNA (cytosine1962-C5)-methyltransferase
MKTKLAKTIEKAFGRRLPLLAATNALRLINGKGDGLPGITLDRFDRHFLIQTYSSHPAVEPALLAEYIQSHLPADFIILKNRTLPAADCARQAQVLLANTGSNTEVLENGLRFAVDLHDTVNPGLFLDMRANRLRLATLAKNRKVLNTFAYTCAFGAFACQGGASQVVNVDISRKYLEWGKRNYALNGLPVRPEEFVTANCAAFLKGASKWRNTFDLIILDPPSFSRHQGRTFTVKTQLPDLIAASLNILNPRGTLLVSTNHSEISPAQLERWVRQASKSLGWEPRRIELQGQDLDFPGSGTMKESHLAAVIADFR